MLRLGHHRSYIAAAISHARSFPGQIYLQKNQSRLSWASDAMPDQELVVVVGYDVVYSFFPPLNMLLISSGTALSPVPSLWRLNVSERGRVRWCDLYVRFDLWEKKVHSFQPSHALWRFRSRNTQSTPIVYFTLFPAHPSGEGRKISIGEGGDPTMFENVIWTKQRFAITKWGKPPQRKRLGNMLHRTRDIVNPVTE